METSCAFGTRCEARSGAAGYNELTSSFRKEIAGLARSGITPVTLALDIADAGKSLTMAAGSWRDTVQLDRDAVRCFGSKPACGRGADAAGACRIIDALPADLSVNLIAIRHSISYLPHALAVCLLKRLRRMVPAGGKLFVSALGLHSDLGDRYPQAETEVALRYSPITTPDPAHPMAGTRLCLYSERDLVITLLSSGWSVLRSSSTTEGNVLASATWNPGLAN